MVGLVKKNMMSSKYSDIKVGLIARKDYGGLAFQTHALYKLLQPFKTLVVDSTPFNGNKQHKGWYPTATHISSGYPPDEMIRSFLDGLDLVITCEVPYNNNLYDIAREMGVKTVLQPNAELNPHFNDRKLSKPDIFVLPSGWYYGDTCRLGIKTYICPPPIDINPVFYNKYKEQGKLKVLHMKGKKAAYDRNGTDIVSRLNIEDVQIDIHDQSLNPVDKQSDIYEKDYDLVLIPRRYGGLCLPMYESLGYGLPVVMTNIDPNNKVLPAEWLIDFSSRRLVRTKRSIYAFEADIRKLHRRLIEFRDMDNETFQVHKFRARKLYDEYERNQVKWFDIIEDIYNDR